MSWGEAVLWWLPTAAVAAMVALGVATLAGLPRRAASKYWLAALLVGGALAVGASGWQQGRSRAEFARLREETGHLNQIGRLLGAAPDTPQNFDAIAAAIEQQNAKLKDLEAQLHSLEEASKSRTINADTATQMAGHLHEFGNHRVVLSCVPEDFEAYRYANQIANVLRTAGWEALGPETTTIFGDAPAMGVTLYVRAGAAPPEAARLLIDAFTRFNIPYQSGVAASNAIPDPETVELFVGHKP